ncbi:MAG: CbtA family protein [Pseudomonadota bacterium]|nr:CbtA family protein [Pseudomonadota bacterium]
MFRRIFLTALVAGLLSGVGISVVQEFTTTPVILHAEKFEDAKRNNNNRHHSQKGHSGLGDNAHSHDEPHHANAGASADMAWAPNNGIERKVTTTLANILTGIGFALILTACFAIDGSPIHGRTGILWGIAGFGIVNLAPALGLPPEVPGLIGAELGGRQAWWFCCVAGTAAGLWLMVFRAGTAWAIGGIVLIALPHVVGGPRPHGSGGAVPPELAAHFVAASLFTAAVFWCMLGWLSGTFWIKLTQKG